MIQTSLFGQALELKSAPDEFTINDSNWRTKAIYEPFLSAYPLPKSGVAIDVGAAYGGFAIPFALAYPSWTIWCFEPDDKAFAALSANISDHKLKNVIAVNAAVGGEGGKPSAALLRALKAKDGEKVKSALAKGPFFQHREKRGYVEAHTPPEFHEEFDQIAFPAFPPEALNELGATLLKITAPGSENNILAAVRDSSIEFIVGELWKPVPSGLTYRSDGVARQVYLPLAGTTLKLRQSRDSLASRAGLDVVVAMYNTAGYIQECIDSIINNSAEDVRAIVVDDGSTDGCGDIVKELYADNPRVTLLRKLNGGCASARNYGRLHSNATHITFIDADDVVDADLYPVLLEIARYSGCELTQGGFAFLHEDENGERRLEPSYEDRDFGHFERQHFGDVPFFVVPNNVLMIGQPTIWRRVYRRDFLDNKKIWFPEHIRAFDDQIFQMLTLLYASDVYCTDKVKYQYRQHPGQDIKQGDERFFYSLEMFRMMLKRGLSEGWNDFDPILQSYVNTVNWIYGGLRPELKPIFIKGAAELWVYMQKALGPGPFRKYGARVFDAVDFAYHAQRCADKLSAYGDSYMWAYLDSKLMHVEMVRGNK
ncbi:FkbM family methyltransferase [Confluentimicrobium naphthalenivorans]|uniref:FkbM family methyltransferase n=2 Tax=Roseobacteraceae TaxID=2854170 RepID=A0A840C9H2_9RHOB|nr:FkbM family methyltransferase [Actibacterium naphthalenivorans]